MSVLHVVFKVGKSEYALAAADVLQMESYSGATPVPGSKPWVSGIIQVRGRIVPVVDVRMRFGLPPQEQSMDSRVVVAMNGERAVALLVDAAREVLKLEPDKLHPPPQIVATESRGLVKAVAQVGQRLVMLLDLAKLMEEEQ
jgi:purine-binding chemotaxis protein CheW